MAENVKICGTCGKTTRDSGHLCDPVLTGKSYVCEHCGDQSKDPRHICEPKLQNINFICMGCGRVAELPSQVCNPRDIVLMAKKDPPEKIM
jgi:hypothetical protein